MFKNTIRLLIIIFILGLSLNSPSFVFSQTQDATSPEVIKLNKEIQAKKDQVKKIQDQQKVYEDSIKAKQSEQASLSNQLSILENRLAKAQLDIAELETEMDRINLEIQKTNLDIAEKDDEIAREKEHISEILRLIYKQDRVTDLEAILMNESLTDFLNQMKYLEDVNDEVAASLENLSKIKEEMEVEKVDLNDKNKKLSALKDDLESKKGDIEDEQGTKNYILAESKNSEKEYQRLLAKAKAEQQAAAADIAGLEKTVRQKLSSQGDKKLELNTSGLIWPVPKNTITALFHDPDYPFKKVFEHPAVDIRAGQGTTIKAAASGYVARAYLNGTNYAYIMIVHGDGISTVYGHVSKIFVDEDEYVVQGQAIGASGGMPGTIGSGGMTTGSHLHFEVRLNGIPVNPLEYLP